MESPRSAASSTVLGFCLVRQLTAQFRAELMGLLEEAPHPVPEPPLQSRSQLLPGCVRHTLRLLVLRRCSFDFPLGRGGCRGGRALRGGLAHQSQAPFCVPAEGHSPPSLCPRMLTVVGRATLQLGLSRDQVLGRLPPAGPPCVPRQPRQHLGRPTVPRPASSPCKGRLLHQVPSRSPAPAQPPPCHGRVWSACRGSEPGGGIGGAPPLLSYGLEMGGRA